MSIRAMAVAGLLLGMTMPAHGGLLDSAAPNFGDQPGKVVYRMGPVHFDPGWADTIVTCDSLADAPMQVAIEIFDGQDALAGMVTRGTVAPGGQVIFATSADAGSAGALVILGLAPLENGKVRVSGTSSKLSCSGKHRIRSADGGTKEYPLELVKKVARDD